jgi:hypothetical protein
MELKAKMTKIGQQKIASHMIYDLALRAWDGGQADTGWTWMSNDDN